MKIKTVWWLVPLFAFVFFDIQVFGRFDLLPDVIGYFGLFVCFTALLEHDRKFVYPQNFALLLFLLELAFLFGLVPNPGLLQALRLIGAFGDLLLVSYAMRALASLADKYDQAAVGRAAEKTFYFFLPTVPLYAVSLLSADLSGLLWYASLLLYAAVLLRLYSVYRGLLTPADISLDMEEP